MGKESRVNRINKTISFTEEHFDVLEFLKEQGNASKYIIDLIREDMTEKKGTKIDEVLHKLDKIEGILLSGGFKPTEAKRELSAEVKNKVLNSLKIMLDEDEFGDE